MHNHRDRPLSKYVPDSPTSPHVYPQDSFEAEELSRSLPHAPIPPHNYELTFKKEEQDRYFARQPRGLAARNLFESSEYALVDHIRQPLAEYHHKTLEELSCLPFADLMSVELPQALREKLGVIGEIVEAKRMRLKASSAGVNLRCLRVRESLSHQDKHRLFLLDLLWKQLSKKVFLQELKLNLAQSRYLRLYPQNEQEGQSSSRQENTHRGRPEFLQQEGEDHSEQYSRQNSHLWQREDGDGSDSENWQEKLIVFSHSVGAFFQKQLFFAFTRISHARLHVPSPNPKSAIDHEYESIPLVSRPNITDQGQEGEGEGEGEGENQISENKLQQLHFYIEELHEECAESENLLKRYFIKLKINLLESIAESMLNQIRANSMYPAGEEQQSQPQPQPQPQPQAQGECGQSFREGRESRLTSELSQDGSLKGEKRMLKERLRERKACSFFSCLREYCEARKISAICLEMRKGGMLHKAFQALAENAKAQKLAREMDGYYQEVASEQCEDDGASKFFHKANLLYSYFQRFKENLRDQRMLRVLNALTLRLALRTLKLHAWQQQRQAELVERHRTKARGHLVFKFFSGWKQVYLSENCLNDRFRLHMGMRERETLQYYFSVLKLQFKRALLRERKADQHYHCQLRGKAFMAMKYLYQDSRQFSERTSQLEEYLHFSRGSAFLQRLQQFCVDYTAYQRFSVKEEKLRRTLLRLHALQSIKQWRQGHLRKQAYQAIEMKLIRFNNKQRKRQIFGRWLERTQQVHRSTGSSPSEHHKDWLVKYYGDLCSFLPS